MVFQTYNPRLSDEWTSERVALLLALDAENKLRGPKNKLTRAQIAEKLSEETGSKFTRLAVICKLLRLSATKQKTPPIQKPLAVFRKPFPDPVVDSLKISLDELRETNCRYITSGDGLPLEFCGHPIKDRSFCEDHYRICYFSKPKINNFACEAA